MADEVIHTPDTIEEAGASENSLSPGRGTAGGDIKMRTIADIVAKLGTMSDEDINNFKDSIAQIGHEADPIADGSASKNVNSIKAKPSAASTRGVVREDLTRLFANEGSEESPLSESFVDQAATLFEAAVDTRVAIEIEAIEEDANQQLQEAVAAATSDMVSRMDQYLDYFAEEYVTRNQVAIDAGIRTEIAEGLMEDFKNIFTNRGINVPDSDVDIIAGLNAEIESLQEQLQQATTTLIESHAAEERASIDAVNTEICEGMTDVARDRLLTVLENVDYDDAEDYRTKATMIRDKFFAESAQPATDTGLVLEEVQAVDPKTLEEAADPTPAAPQGRMGKYVQTISRTANT